jgi:hypothetical protein
MARWKQCNILSTRLVKEIVLHLEVHWLGAWLLTSAHLVTCPATLLSSLCLVSTGPHHGCCEKQELREELKEYELSQINYFLKRFLYHN